MNPHTLQEVFYGSTPSTKAFLGHFSRLLSTWVHQPDSLPFLKKGRNFGDYLFAFLCGMAFLDGAFS